MKKSQVSVRPEVMAAVFEAIEGTKEVMAIEAKGYELFDRIRASVSPETMRLVSKYSDTCGDVAGMEIEAAFILGVKWASDPASFLLGK